VVLAVGARLCGQASCATPASSRTSASFASVESARPHSAISLAPRRLTCGTMLRSSSLSPECDHAEVAVIGLGRMQEVRGRAGRGQRGSDLARDVAGFSDTAHHHAPAPLEDERQRGEEALVDALDQRAHRFGLDGQHPPRKLERGFSAALSGLRGCPYHPRGV